MKKIVLAAAMFVCLTSFAGAQETFVDTLQANKDSFIDANFPTNNYGGEDFLTLYHDGADPVMTMFIGFDVSEIMGAEEEYVLDKATLILDATHVSDPADIQLAAIEEDWDEMTINFNNQPDVMEDGIDTVTLDNSGVFLNEPGIFSLDMTATALAMWLNKVFGFTVRTETVKIFGRDYSFDFNSRNLIAAFNANPAYYGPLLILEYHTAAVEEEVKPAVYFNVAPISRGSAEISYSLPQGTSASLKIYDASGSLVKTLKTQPGDHSISFNGDPGVYFVRFETESRVFTKKTIIVY